jgi:exodeoxyribonuclease VII large subunit
MAKITKQKNLFSENPQTLSVSKYIELINSNLEILRDIYVEGEVSEFKISQEKWVRFKLKDEEEEAIVDCFTVVFKLNVPLEDGMKIRIQGRPRIYARYGRFSITVDNIELAGQGSLKRAFEITKAKLKAEGLFAEARKRDIPEYPKNIGLITSHEAAAYTDFLKVLRHRFGGLKVFFHATKVQGKDAEEEIVQAFDWFNNNYLKNNIELIVLTRGGGALEDLQAFNSEKVARAIFSSKLPVVCGVGHERDESLADFVADVRASTPSNAAELIVRDRKEIISEIESLVSSMEMSLQSHLSYYENFLEHFLSRSNQTIKEKTYDIKQTLLIFAQHIKSLKSVTNQKKAEIDYLTNNLSRNVFNAVNRLKREVFQQISLLRSYNPRAVLKRGYGIIRKNGKIIKRSRCLEKGDRLETTLYEGKFKSLVKSVNSK